ncbi:hypothetical protein [Butyrivibrio hungatei]|uniref:hypothetical protein n=1 Tax=Butyrivibrio hungatei TaxID=185008 RepID=UPI00041271EF|nr:hypothetical protein [Butyrivibrio hungatei]
MIEELLKDITLDYLKDTEIGANIQKAMNGIAKAQETVLAYMNDDSPEQLKRIRIGTIATFAILGKIASGKNIKEFDKQDWIDIASKISDLAILPAGQQYSVEVFEAYADYVDISVKLLDKNGISKEKCEAISRIAKEVRKLSKDVSKGIISEVDYTEKCLWLLLEAMIKLITSYSAILLGEDLAQFNQSVAMLAFEYGRYSLYKRESEILNQYIEYQATVDAELEAKLDKYRDEIQERSKVFDELLANAFSLDISERLKASAEIARNVGVDETEILDSVEKIDDFFG